MLICSPVKERHVGARSGDFGRRFEAEFHDEPFAIVDSFEFDSSRM